MHNVYALIRIDRTLYVTAPTAHTSGDIYDRMCTALTDWRNRASVLKVTDHDAIG